MEMCRGFAALSGMSDKGTTLPELTTTRPADPTRLEDFQDEWADAAAAAGVTSKQTNQNEL